ncbi:S8 family peptidase [Pedobacter sp. MC2016-14]|uniref:S8 family peptidase n=1 Tax=Pedobacter sp. MC2016-14 TaxID=2897327 RepID=UPI001E459124|nr:S8 family peptidase [Pedobacter sp. MC2016-14]MCD0486757.1 S8 family peptidase [Pedobacter sp. MC2016-14]
MKKTIAMVMCLLPALGFAQQAPQNWHMLSKDADNVYGIGVIKAYDKLLKGKTPKPVVVCVLDGGIDTLHEDLKANLWRNPKEVLGGDKDLDGNGYKGDALGWNFLGGPNGQVTAASVEYQRVYHMYKAQFAGITDEKQVKKKDLQHYRSWVVSKSLLTKADSVAPVDYRGKQVKDDYFNKKDRFYGNSNLIGDPYFHGTHVGGIIGATRGNGKGMDGIADNVKLMGVRVVPNGDEYDKDVALGIRYAVDNGAQIINMSFGKRVSPERELVEEAIKYADKKGVLLINAAGNDGADVDSIPHYPTPFFMKGGKRAPNMITVGASGATEAGLVAPFSNYGDQTVDVFAPGVGIYATVPDNKYRPMSGTSMATPVVAGLAALIKGYYPDLTAKQLKYIIEQSVTKITIPVTKPKSGGKKVAMTALCRTGGIVNAYDALILADQISKGK